MKIFILTIFFIWTFMTAVSVFRCGHPVKQSVINILQGLLSLTAVNVLGLYSGVTLSINWYTLAAVLIYGLPGTVALTILRFIFR